MKKVYLDNASTTAIRSEVIQEITRLMTEDYGNPSSTHSFGRNAKSVLELSRKSIAKQLNVVGSEIFFTSSGTEANNWILRSAVRDLGVQRIITTKIEHHAVLYPVLALQKELGIQVDFVNIKSDGSIDMTHLAELLSQEVKTLVSLMHVNNEVGVVLDLERVVTICKEHNALFHSDTVQSVGKTEIDLKALPIDFISASAHKFHGPKGIGFAFIRKNSGLQPLLLGGEQEKGMRGGTESVYQIAGMAKALEIAYANLHKERLYISDLKKYCTSQIALQFPNAKIIDSENSFYNIIKQFASNPKVKELVITENGAAFNDKLINGVIEDNDRIAYFKLYLQAMLKAKNEGIKITGYMAWTLMDNFEWAEGYEARFGLVYNDFKTQQRTIKKSGYWWQQFLNGH